MKQRLTWSVMANGVREGARTGGLGSGGNGCRFDRLEGNALETSVNIAYQQSRQERGGHGHRERCWMAEEPDMVKPDATLPISKEQLDLPPETIELGDIMRREDVAR